MVTLKDEDFFDLASQHTETCNALKNKCDNHANDLQRVHSAWHNMCATVSSRFRKGSIHIPPLPHGCSRSETNFLGAELLGWPEFG
ncbi:hypothetical protein IG631_07355 [Alternaria alternata]|nr:hypothetical protein IG631_07355 [Alternaria alternata]